MPNNPQILEIDPPAEIMFKGPFTEVVTSYLKLTNPSDQQVCFKVKTTAPKQYCVRPNSGFIPSRGQVNVAIMLQPFDVNSEERAKHKFMVQSTYVTDGETSLDTIWKNTSPHMLMDSKLKVVFDVPEAAMNETPVSHSVQRSSAAPPMADAELRRLVDETKRLQQQLQKTEEEKTRLREKIMRIEASGSSGGGGALKEHERGAISFLHVIIVAVFALIAGLVCGRIFS